MGPGMVEFYGKCREMYHTRMLWDIYYHQKKSYQQQSSIINHQSGQVL